ncbi:hydrogen peroxide-inducible genes activator [Zavarzinia compransoris]|nr:hydrogen peroxide-inducible genes activator [Zavarzinia compransoris]
MKHLRYFEALARLQHFGRAAEACAISQPALSLQIKELEEILGSPLVERGSKQIHLTGFGEIFAARAHDILRAVDDLEDLARASRRPLSGRLRLGVIPTVAPYYLPAAIKTLTLHFPHLDLHPREAVTQTLIAELAAGRLDTALVALPVSEPGLFETPLFDEDFLLVRPAADAALPPPGLDTLPDLRLLLLEEGHCFRDQAISFCRIPAARSKDLMEGSSLGTLVQMVGAGIGVTLIPEMAVPVESRAAPVSIVALPAPPPSRTIGLVWRKTPPLARHLNAIAEALRTAGRPGG